MIVKGDKIRLTKALPSFNFVGSEFEVVEVIRGEIDMISFKCDYGVGGISSDVFDRYFEKVIVPPWTDWENVLFEGVVYQYRSNGVQVELRRDGLTVSSSCHPYDEFDLETGIRICVQRLKTEILDIA